MSVQQSLIDRCHFPKFKRWSGVGISISELFLVAILAVSLAASLAGCKQTAQTLHGTTPSAENLTPPEPAPEPSLPLPSPEVDPELEYLASADQLCAFTAELYNRCGKAFHFDSKTFHFTNTGGNRSVPCHDGRKLSFYDRIDAMDIASIFMFPYVAGTTPLPEKRRNWDPGRLRSEDLLKAVFGGSAAEVRANLVNVSFLNQTVQFQKNLGAAAALSRVSQELLAGAKKDSTLAKFLEPYTSKKVNLRDYIFVWRNVAGTNRLSTHSFATGIDLLQDKGPQYWLWDEKQTNPERAKLGEVAYRDIHYIPARTPYFHPTAVEIFERHGFIWGGKWNHYDTMHFEYRPELLRQAMINCPARLEPSHAGGDSDEFFGIGDAYDFHGHDH